MEVNSVKANYVKIYWQYYRSLEKRFLKTEVSFNSSMLLSAYERKRGKKRNFAFYL